MKEFKCPQCGGNRLKPMEDGYYKCQYCRVMFRPEPPVPPVDKSQEQQVVVNVNVPNVAQQEQDNDKLYCPHCGSSQLTTNNKGFGVGKAITGALLTGGVGILAGFAGSNKIKVTCLQCGKQWEPGSLRTTPLPIKQNKSSEDDVDEIDGCGCVFAFLIFIIIIVIMALISR